MANNSIASSLPPAFIWDPAFVCLSLALRYRGHYKLVYFKTRLISAVFDVRGPTIGNLVHGEYAQSFMTILLPLYLRPCDVGC